MFHSITPEDWYGTGVGTTAEIFFNHDDEHLALKLYKPHINEAYVIQEFQNSAKVASLGFSTPRALELVTMQDRKGIVFERVIGKESIGMAINQRPDRLEELMEHMVTMARQLHSTQANTTEFPSIVQRSREIVAESTRLSPSQAEKLYMSLDEMDGPTTCVHGDFHVCNVIASPNGTHLIDLPDFSYGDPRFDVASLYFVSVVRTESNPEAICWLLHMNKEQLQESWRFFCREYADVRTASQREEYQHELDRFAIFELLRKGKNLRFRGGYEQNLQDYIQRLNL